jgi:hypothetical protein
MNRAATVVWHHEHWFDGRSGATGGPPVRFTIRDCLSNSRVAMHQSIGNVPCLTTFDYLDY